MRKKDVYKDGFINGVGEFYMTVPMDVYDEEEFLPLFAYDMESHGIWLYNKTVSCIVSEINKYAWDEPKVVNKIKIIAEVGLRVDNILGSETNGQFTPRIGRYKRIVDTRCEQLDFTAFHHFHAKEFEYLSKNGRVMVTRLDYNPVNRAVVRTYRKDAIDRDVEMFGSLSHLPRVCELGAQPRPGHSH